jgi:hypothetical protein
MTVFALAAQSNADGIPSLGGKCFLTVASDSMSPTFNEGDLLISSMLTDEEKMSLKPGEVITFHADLDGDGSCESITIADSYEGEFGVDRTLSLRISTSETDYTEKLMANDCEAYYVKTADGKNYLYVLMELEAQTELYTFHITDTGINKVGTQTIAPHYSDQTVSVLTDPDNMHFDILGNADVEPVGDDFFNVGYDGMPVRK